MSKKHKYASSAAPVFSDEENDNSTIDDSIEQNADDAAVQNDTDIRSEEKPRTSVLATKYDEQFLNNLVAVKVIGNYKVHGFHHMKLLSIVNSVVRNPGDYKIIVSELTQKTVVDIIKNHTELLGNFELSDESKEIVINRFINDCKNFAL